LRKKSGPTIQLVPGELTAPCNLQKDQREHEMTWR